MRTIVVCLSLLGLSSCNNIGTNPAANNYLKLSECSWLQGSWASPGGDAHEIWERKNDSEFTGMSYAMKGADTVFIEHLSLVQKGSDVFYVPAVADQNEGKPVLFKLISNINGVFIFENKEHDFPQRIVYANPTPDSLYAFIEGNEQGKYHKIDFPMKKVKQ